VGAPIVFDCHLIVTYSQNNCRQTFIKRIPPMRPTLPACAVFLLLAAAVPASADDWTLAAGGNFQYDWLQFRSDRAAVADADDFRRARISLTAKYGKTLELKAEHDLKPQAWTDVFVRWNVGGGHSLRLGQFKQPLYLEELTSDKVSTFMEQGSPSAFAIARRVGVEYAYAADRWAVTTTTFGQTLEGANDGTGFAVRGTWLPLRDDTGFLHLGAAVATESPDAATARFSARPEAGLSVRRFADSGTLAGVDRINRAGLEAALVRGPWLLQSEYLAARATRDGADFSGDGWYVLGSWFPFGQSRGYKNGAIDAPRIEGNGPAIELALRYSHLDLDDGSVAGGEQGIAGAGLTWWISSDIRLMANYLRVDSERRGIADDPNILEFRAQLAF
jgi:phosphate-selective porin OprO/OprP